MATKSDKFIKGLISKRKGYTDILPGKKKYRTMLIGEKVAQEGSGAKRGEYKRAIRRIAERPYGLSGGGRATHGYGKAYLKGPMDMLQLYEQKYQTEVQKFGGEQIGRRRRDDYTDGEPRIPVPSQTP